MQQLKQLQIIEQSNEVLIILTPLETIHWDEFSVFSSELLQHCPKLFPIGEPEVGADMHITYFRFLGALFAIVYEGYSESIWISAQETQAEKNVRALYENLSIMIKTTD